MPRNRTSRRARTPSALIAIVVAFTIGGASRAEGADAPTAEPDASSGSQDAQNPGTSGAATTPDDKDATKLQTAFGKTATSDYTSKHFSLLFGAVILNQFRVKSGDPNAPLGTTNNLVLDQGTTDAQVFLEGNFRYRWAWLDRGPAVPSGGPTREQLAAQVAVAKSKLEEALADQAAAEQAAGQPAGADKESGKKVAAARAKVEGAEQALAKFDAAKKEVAPYERREELDIDPLRKQKALLGASGDRASRAEKLVCDGGRKEDLAKVEALVAAGRDDVADAELASERVKASRQEALRAGKELASLEDQLAALEKKKTESEKDAAQKKEIEGKIAEARTRAEAPSEETLDLQQETLAFLKSEASDLATTKARDPLCKAAVDRAALARDLVEARQQRVAKLEADMPELLRRLRERDAALEVWREQKHDEPLIGYSFWSWNASGAWRPWKWRPAWFLPDDWGVQLGYAFGGNTGTSTTDIVGASDLYAELTMGWNLFRWSMPVEKQDEVPIRGSISFEGATLWFTDKAIQDIHRRSIIGLSAAFGVPFQLTASDEPSIVELLVRMGGVNVEIPRFIDSTTRQIKADNFSPEFNSGWGFGFDVELNVPITKDLGYVALRGGMNSGFNPNPWTISIGYTIPLATLVKGLGAGG